ncbi:MAG: HEPN domain-containing protein [Methanofastidiosum sp.]
MDTSKKNIIATKWLRQSLHDLEMAEKNIDIKGYDITAFLCHQAVEKLLKAIYLLEKGIIPKSHYIDEIAIELKIGNELLDLISELTIDYTYSRYPDVSDKIPYEEYDEKLAREKLEVATNIFVLLENKYKTILGD